MLSDCPGADLVTGMCICDDGYVMEGGKCIRKSNCGCKLEDGSRVPNGFSQMSRDCSIMCQCTDSYWNCNQHYCSGNTICQADPNNSQLGQCTPSGKGTISQTYFFMAWSMDSKSCEIVVRFLLCFGWSTSEDFWRRALWCYGYLSILFCYIENSFFNSVAIQCKTDQL